MTNDFCHLELQTSDTEGAKKFYSALFDWDLESMPMESGEEYTIVKPGKGPMGGIMKNPAPEAPSGWLVYITVDNIEKSLKKAVELGSKMVVGKRPVPGMGSFAMLFDPQGAVFAIWEPERK